MGWFVALAGTDLTACSEGDLKNLQDACEVIRMVPISLSRARVDRTRYDRAAGWVGSAWPDLHELTAIHEAVAAPIKQLADLTDDGHACVRFSSTVTHTVEFYKASEAAQREGYAPLMIASTDEVAGSSPHVWRDQFTFRAASLLETYADKIRRCPHCTTVFLQLRKTPSTVALTATRLRGCDNAENGNARRRPRSRTCRHPRKEFGDERSRSSDETTA